MYIQKSQGKNSDWYWALIADNGESIAIGGEGYVSERECNRAINRVKAAMADAEVRKMGVFGWSRDTEFYATPNALGLMGRPFGV